MSPENEKATKATLKSTSKRFFALIGVVLLVLMYVMTMVFAIIDNPATMNMFKASIALTIFVPVMLYAYQLVYRVLKGMGVKKSEPGTDSDNTSEI